MNSSPMAHYPSIVWHRRAAAATFAMLLAVAFAPEARASLFHGETLDKVANVISWVAIIVAPIIGVAVFWLVHILPEKIAEKKQHPQTKAIQVLCVLSLFFGGLLWPLAWLWAYSKPVLYKLAYGTDVDESHGSTQALPMKAPTKHEAEIEELRLQVAALQRQLHVAGQARAGGKS